MIAVENSMLKGAQGYVLISSTNFDLLGHEEEHKLTISNPSATRSVLLKMLMPSHFQYKWQISEKIQTYSENFTIVLTPQRSIEMTLSLKNTNVNDKNQESTNSLILSHCHRDKVILLAGILSPEETEKNSKRQLSIFKVSQLIEVAETQSELWNSIENECFQKFEITINNFFMVHNNPHYTCVLIQKVFSSKGSIEPRIDLPFAKSQSQEKDYKDYNYLMGGMQDGGIIVQKEKSVGNFLDESDDSEDEEEEDHYFIKRVEKYSLVELIKTQVGEKLLDIFYRGDKLFLAFDQKALKKLSSWQQSLFMNRNSESISFFVVIPQPSQNYSTMIISKNSISSVTDLNSCSKMSSQKSLSPHNSFLTLKSGKSQEDKISNVNYNEQRERSPSPVKHFKNRISNDETSTPTSLKSNSQQENISISNTNIRYSNKNPKLSCLPIFEIGEEESSFLDQFQARHSQQIDFPVTDKQGLTSLQSQSSTQQQFNTLNNGDQSITECIPKDSSDLHCFESEDFRLSKLSSLRSQKEGSIYTGQNNIKHIMLSDDSSHFITADDTGLITVWEIATKQIFKFEDCIKSDNAQIAFLKSFRDNDRFMVGGNSKNLKIYSLKQRCLIKKIEAARKIIYCATLLFDLNLIAVAGLNLSKLASLGKDTKRRNIKFYNSITYDYVKKLNIPSTENIVTHIDYCQMKSTAAEDISPLSSCENSSAVENPEKQRADEVISQKKLSLRNINFLACVIQGSYGSRLMFISISKGGQKMSISLNCEMLTINVFKVHRFFFCPTLKKIICLPKPSDKRGQAVLSFYEIDVEPSSKIKAVKHTPSFEKQINDIHLLANQSTLLIIPNDQFFFLYDLKDQAIIDRSNALQSYPTYVHISPQNIAGIHLSGTEGKVNIFKLPC